MPETLPPFRWAVVGGYHELQYLDEAGDYLPVPEVELESLEG